MVKKNCSKCLLLPEEIPYPTADNLKTGYNSNHCLSVHKGEIEIQHGLKPREPEQDVQDLHVFCERLRISLALRFKNMSFCYSLRPPLR